MHTLNIWPSFWLNWFVLCGVIMTSYFASAGSVYWLLYRVFWKPAESVQAERQSTLTIADDVKLSVLSAIIFALGMACVIACYCKGVTKAYFQLDTHSLGYLVFSYVIVLLLQDTYFYFVHRLFHLPLFFQWFHRGHHQSRPPRPGLFWHWTLVKPLHKHPSCSA